MSQATNANTRIAGTLQDVDGLGILRMEGRYDTDIDDLWSAVTDPSRLARWLAEVDGDLRIGGEVRATFTNGMEGSGRIEVCQPPRQLVVVMTIETQTERVFAADLVPDGDQTRLVVEERGLPLDELADHGAGWQAHLEDLTAYYAGRERSDWFTRWTELRASYRALPVTRR